MDFLLHGDARLARARNILDGKDKFVHPTPPRSERNSPSNAMEEQQNDVTTNNAVRSPPRRWTRKRCGIDESVAKDTLESPQRGEGLFIRVDKYGDTIPVPWNDPLPSVVLKHVAMQQDRSCLDFDDEPVFSSFSGRYALDRLNRPVELGRKTDEEKMPLSERRHRAHKVLEKEESAAQDILPPPARQPRLPVPVAEAAVEGFDEDYDAEYQFFAESAATHAQELGSSCMAAEHSPSWSLPPSTVNNNNNNAAATAAASPSRSQHRHHHHHHHDRPQRPSSAITQVADVSPRRFALFSSYGNGTAATEHHVAPTLSVPRPTHSPRALKQFMSPRRGNGVVGASGAASLNSSGYGNALRAATASGSPGSSSRGAAAAYASPQPSMRPEDFPSPARSNAPLRVNDLVSILKKPRPQSARSTFSASSGGGSPGGGAAAAAGASLPFVPMGQRPSSSSLSRHKLPASTARARFVGEE